MTRFRLPIGLSLTVLLVIVLAASVSFPTAHGQSNRNATLATEADYQRALKELFVICARAVAVRRSLCQSRKRADGRPRVQDATSTSVTSLTGPADVRL